MRELKKIEIKKKILSYLIKKGKIRATIYLKIKKFAIKSNYDLEIFNSCLFELMWDEKIDILIPQIFEMEWMKEKITNVTHIPKNLDYYFRKFKKINYPKFRENGKEGYYYFNSRRINFESENIREKSRKYLLNTFSTYPSKILIYYPINSGPLDIYDPIKIPLYNIKSSNDIKVGISWDKEKHDILIPLHHQIDGKEILESFRAQHACAYITIIESIHKIIFDIQNGRIKKGKEYLKNSINKFSYYCEMFTTSDWIENYEENPFRWENFFVFFRLPIKVLTMRMKSIKFSDNRTFETCIALKYGLMTSSSEIINFLEKYGYKELKSYNHGSHKYVGSSIEILIPCPAIEYYYFIAKYLLYYHLFLLLFHSSQIMENLEWYENPFKPKEKELYKEFLPIIQDLFEIDDSEPNKNLIFKYYTTNSEELEVLYNYFLMRKIRKLEKQLSNYMVLKNLKKEQYEKKKY